MQKLTALKVAKGILKNWDKLGCNTGKIVCRYRYDDGTGCAIGVNLTERSIEKIIANWVNDSSLLALREVRIASYTEVKVSILQTLHDCACVPSPITRKLYIKQLREMCESIIEDAKEKK